MSMMRSVPTCETEVTLRVRRNLRRRATKGEGAAAVALAKAVRWHRKPESMTSCSLCSGFANLRRKIRVERS